ncbi:aminotransferase class I/II-fold pyridoxal phosphate-dependent enzyme [Lachnospiraceae bacterium CLA-AA-H215]|uniref:Aminotransferase class I/II-fold pyridoxal phosphate-dependent enzyme n=1 Tax=Hominifimenecus microfluidus TaxID=2885348 RepID=A0AAE3EEE8_9FIRM|nr:aminotransferase class I/II-fold pyridoxal phosphate-dependent enzyme [Hominifimenecus microfluidus]MCC2232471.1 aminotransferase class I/II-fold pyridoxal phosphate-dependent enzyme [Hominifimenecus microfluidus]
MNLYENYENSHNTSYNTNYNTSYNTSGNTGNDTGNNNGLLWRKLADYAAGSAVPMHMPGHKRNMEDFPWLARLRADWDITEIDGFDNLNDAEEILLESQQRAAALWGAKHSRYLVNGSTGGILAAVRAALIGGGEVLAARNCHKSVYHALELCGNPVHFFLPEWITDFGIFSSVSPETIQANLERYPAVRLVILTSPTYEGICSDIASIADICHAHGAALLVDEAHGAHLGFHEGFPSGAVAGGADLVVQSLHKTLPCLTQTAILHWNSEIIPWQEVARQTAIFQSSSPSYLFTAAMDGCVNYVEEHGAEAFERWINLLRLFDREAEKLQLLLVLGHGRNREEPRGYFAKDPSKLVISARGSGHTGGELMERLREAGIELEMSSAEYALAMTGMGDTEENIRRLAQALLAIDRAWSEAAGDKGKNMPGAVASDARLTGTGGEEAAQRPAASLPEVFCPVGEAMRRLHRICLLSEAEGQVSAEYIWAYPPGIPILIPGEILGAEQIEEMRFLQSRGVKLHTTWGENAEQLHVLRDR